MPTSTFFCWQKKATRLELFSLAMTETLEAAASAFLLHSAQPQRVAALPTIDSVVPQPAIHHRSSLVTPRRSRTLCAHRASTAVRLVPGCLPDRTRTCMSAASMDVASESLALRDEEARGACASFSDDVGSRVLGKQADAMQRSYIPHSSHAAASDSASCVLHTATLRVRGDDALDDDQMSGAPAEAVFETALQPCKVVTNVGDLFHLKQHNTELVSELDMQLQKAVAMLRSASLQVARAYAHFALVINHLMKETQHGVSEFDRIAECVWGYCFQGAEQKHLKNIKSISSCFSTLVDCFFWCSLFETLEAGNSPMEKLRVLHRPQWRKVFAQLETQQKHAVWQGIFFDRRLTSGVAVQNWLEIKCKYHTV